MAGLMPAGNICGSGVVDRDGEALGSITELMIDSDTGAIAYAVLGYGGVLGVGEKLFAVPWSAFEVDATAGTLALRVERARLDAAEGFDKDAWPTGPDPLFAA